MKCPQCGFENPSDTFYCGKCATPLPSSAPKPFFRTETLQSPASELATGSTFAGRYQIIEELGKGGMGRVYKALDTKIKEKIALKLIKPEIASDGDTIERFNNELRLARRIGHRNVCRMFDIGEAEGARFITMEYVHGEDLKTMIRMSGRLSLGMLLSVGKQVCEGLSEAHGLGIVHRDLKPQNIMIDRNGNAKIMDFGIARSPRDRKITDAGVMVGTPEYMSPEQAEAKDVDHRSDIYSLGIILYEMATSRVPFEGETALSVAMKHKGEPPREPRSLNPDIPADLNSVILKCLEKERIKRYQNAADLRLDLDRIERGIPTAERVVPGQKPLTSSEITVKINPRKLVIPAAAVILLGAVGLFLLLRSRGPGLDPRRVAVAIFENRTGDASLANIGRMAADSVAQGLTEIKGLDVVPPAAVESATGEFKGGDYVRYLADKTLAGQVVSGAYFLQAGTLRFQSQVTDAGKGKLLYALDPVTGPLSSVAETTESLRQEIMGAVASLHDDGIKEMMDHGVKAPNYGAYLELRAGFDLFYGGEQGRSVEYYERALDRDPDFKYPMMAISAVYMNLGKYAELEDLRKTALDIRDSLDDFTEIYVIDYAGARLRGDLEAMYRAQKRISGMYADTWNNYSLALASNRVNRPGEAAVLLKALDPKSGYIKDWLGYWEVLTWAYHLLGDHEKELEEARRGLVQHPQRASALGNVIRALAALGRVEDFERGVDEYLALPPGTGYNSGRQMMMASNELRAHGFLEASKAMAARAAGWVENLPRDAGFSDEGRAVLAWARFNEEKWQESYALVEELHTRNPKNWGNLGWLGELAARRGDREEALRISKELENNSEPYTFGGPSLRRARIASVLGAKEEAIELIREALAKGQTVPSLHGVMAFECLRDYPPFKELIKPKG